MSTGEFRELALEQRLGADSLAGRPAEAAFHRYMAGKGYTYGTHFTRYGFDRVDTTAALVASCHPMVAHGPDYVQVGGHVWEVQGFGQSGKVLVKTEKLLALWKFWQEPLGGRQVRFFFFDQPHDAAYVMPIQTVLAARVHPAAVPVKVDGWKDGFEIPVSVFREELLVDPFAWLKKSRELAEKEAEKAEAAAVAATAELVARYGGNTGQEQAS